MRVNVNVKYIKPLKHGRYRVKITETDVNLTDMRHKGVDFTTIKNLGRGRYVMKKVKE